MAAVFIAENAIAFVAVIGLLRNYTTVKMCYGAVALRFGDVARIIARRAPDDPVDVLPCDGARAGKF
jgi:hypothetical protein